MGMAGRQRRINTWRQPLHAGAPVMRNEGPQDGRWQTRFEVRVQSFTPSERQKKEGAPGTLPVLGESVHTDLELIRHTDGSDAHCGPEPPKRLLIFSRPACAHTSSS
jgi:hypothetical protein